MTAKELLAALVKEGLPPEGWGRWVWRGRDGYGISSLVPSNTLPPVEEGEEVLFWWGGVSKANVPYWPENFIPADYEGEEEVEEVAERVLVGHLLAEAVRGLPDGDWEEFMDALRQLEGESIEAEVALEGL
jgi:hypothetical protein